MFLSSCHFLTSFLRFPMLVAIASYFLFCLRRRLHFYNENANTLKRSGSSIRWLFNCRHRNVSPLKLCPAFFFHLLSHSLNCVHTFVVRPFVRFNLRSIATVLNGNKSSRHQSHVADIFALVKRNQTEMCVQAITREIDWKCERNGLFAWPMFDRVIGMVWKLTTKMKSTARIIFAIKKRKKRTELHRHARRLQWLQHAATTIESTSNWQLTTQVQQVSIRLDASCELKTVFQVSNSVHSTMPTEQCYFHDIFFIVFSSNYVQRHIHCLHFNLRLENASFRWRVVFSLARSF